MLKTVTKTEYERNGDAEASFLFPVKTDGAQSGAVFSYPEFERQRRSINLKENTSLLLEKRRGGSVGRCLYTAFVTASLTPVLTQFALAAGGGETIWTKATAIMKDVYSQIVAISSIAAVVCASVALLLMNFSRSDRTVQESRSWLKRIIISWAILNGLGFIMAYITPFFSGGTYTP